MQAQACRHPQPVGMNPVRAQGHSPGSALSPACEHHSVPSPWAPFCSQPIGRALPQHPVPVPQSQSCPQHQGSILSHECGHGPVLTLGLSAVSWHKGTVPGCDPVPLQTNTALTPAHKRDLILVHGISMVPRHDPVPQDTEHCPPAHGHSTVLEHMGMITYPTCGHDPVHERVPPP